MGAVERGLVTVVPMKPLSQAKSRLSPGLSPTQRMNLTLNMLRHVLKTVKASAIGAAWVVGGNCHIRQVAREHGATWSAEQGQDINESLQLAFQQAFDLNKAVLYLPGDLPLVTSWDLQELVNSSAHLNNITIAPATRSGGTNALLLVQRSPFRPLLGPASFAKHLAQAAFLDLPVASYYSRSLGLDIDTTEDLQTLEHMAPGLLSRLLGETLDET